MTGFSLWKGNHIWIESPQGGAKLTVGGCILPVRGVLFFDWLLSINKKMFTALGYVEAP